MPYKGEHSCRLEDPDKFDKFNRVNCEQKHEGKCIDVIYGIKNNKSKVQALRYKIDTWNEDDARAHCKEHEGTFEAAEEDKAMKMETKNLDFELKADAKGKFTARFATLDVRDKDNDIIISGAIEDGKMVLVSAYMHGSWMGKLPVGKAVISEKDGEAIAEGEFNLNTAEGRDTYEAIKFSGDLQEWSFGFYVLEAEDGKEDGANVRYLKKIDIKEISPVLVGAGENTATLAIKNAGEMPYKEQAETVLDAVKELTDRTRSLADLRKKEGRELSEVNNNRIKELIAELEELKSELEKILSTSVEKEDLSGEIDRLYLVFEETKTKILEVT
jgi:HK97 family phage prohead protease